MNGLDFAGSKDSGYSIPVIDNIVIDLKIGYVNAKFVDVAKTPLSNGVHKMSQDS
jgi:hypothetical protein